MIQKLVVILFLSVLTFALLGTAQGVGDTILKPHAPIYINGNSDFTTENGVVSGSGTADDPYIIPGWTIQDTEHGIYIENTERYFMITKCHVSHISGPGIVLLNVTNGTIVDCEVSAAHGDGIGLVDSDANVISSNHSEGNLGSGVTLHRSSNNIIQDNVCSGNGTEGVEVSYHSNGNIIVGNKTEGNGLEGFYGIVIGYDSCDNRVLANELAHNTLGGIHLHDFSCSCYGNTLYHNALLGQDDRCIDTEHNWWDNTVEGNYWGEHMGWDANGDGISDSPYKIEGGGVDRYPLMRPWKSSVVAMGIKFTGPDEFVTVANWSQEDVDLTGWKLQAVNLETGQVQHTLVFPDGCSLPKDGKLRVHSGPGSMTEKNTGGAPSKTDLYGQWGGLAEGSYVWNDLGGMVRIVNPDGKVVDEYEYHWWMGQ